jgi:Fe2+ or Zn2+ uptake regulation protein
MQSFHNTVHLTGYDLSVAIQKAKNQEDVVLAIMANGKLWSPSEVHAVGVKAGKRWPVTSVRRAMSVLEDAGALIKTDTTIPSPLGSIEHCWRKA